MAHTSDNPLVGPQLIQYNKANEAKSAASKALETGHYTVTEKGEKRPSQLRYMNALLEAQGLKVYGTERATRGRGNGVVRCNKQGVLPVSQAYLRQIGVTPHEFAQIEYRADKGEVVVTKAPAQA